MRNGDPEQNYPGILLKIILLMTQGISLSVIDLIVVSIDNCILLAQMVQMEMGHSRG